VVWLLVVLWIVAVVATGVHFFSTFDYVEHGSAAARDVPAGMADPGKGMTYDCATPGDPSSCKSRP
jgi:hypothetical protein